jgi:hypothetical protein
MRHSERRRKKSIGRSHQLASVRASCYEASTDVRGVPVRRQLMRWSAAGMVLICTAGMVVAAEAGGVPRGTSWSRISGGSTPATAAGGQLGLARTADGTLHVIWNRGGGASPATIFDTRISAAGMLGRTTTVARGWAGNGGLALLVMPDKTLRLFAAGMASAHAASGGLNMLTAPSSGNTWTLVPNATWGGATANAAAFAGATLTNTGDIVTSWPSYFHVGLDPQAADSLIHPDMASSPLVTDHATGAIVVAGITIAGKGGTFVRQVLPHPGPSLLLASAGNERSSGLAARLGAPGVYIAYATSNGDAVQLLRYGGTTKTVARGSAFTMTKVFAGPGGRLWVAWGAFRGTQIFVTRSNEAVTAFEPVQTLTLPDPSTNQGVSALQGEGSAGPLDLFADMMIGSEGGFMHTHVLALFSLQAAVGRPTKGKTQAPVRLTLRDAGDPVAGVKIVVAGKQLSTDAKGLTTLALAPGSYTATASAPGYATTSISVTVR